MRFNNEEISLKTYRTDQIDATLYEVASVNWTRCKTPCKKLTIKLHGHNKKRHTEEQEKITQLVPRSACISVEEKVRFLSNSKTLDVCCKNGYASILPSYKALDEIRIGTLKLNLVFKEITESDELNGYEALTQHHYRNKTLFGRHAPLIAIVQHPLLPKVVGYIELTSPFFVNTPRRILLDAPIVLNGVSWNAWNADTAKQRIHLFVRIGRCVVHPELRSSGLGKLLVQHAAQFARTHWQMAGWKPYFLEISADMLRYIPFAEKAGMFFIGETEGNLHRITKDIKYFSANVQRIENKEIFAGNISGILDTKLSRFHKVMSNVSSNTGYKKMERSIAQQIERPTLDGWAHLKDILSLPKPHFIMGLNSEASKRIEQRMKQLDLPKSPAKNGQDFINEVYRSRLLTSIKVKNVSYDIALRVRRTKVTHQVERAFEISLDDLTQTIFRNLDFEIQAGEIWVVTGLSGTGKTTLLKLLDGKVKPTKGEIDIPREAHGGILTPVPTTRPLIEIIGQKDVAKGIYWMNRFGLSEPNLYVKPFSALSAGQKYRSMLAYMLVQGFNVWFIDEFCENLDIINTNLISKQVSRLARETGATVVIASSSAKRFVDALEPNKILLLKGVTDEVDSKIYLTNAFKSQLTH
ncbi:hypothetical protein DCC62_11310 [candidate division KSB1 bacterium]|nr:MAG: hypothetical protein DCC62_11310 [candidate division KSB1 bacterium]